MSTEAILLITAVVSAVAAVLSLGIHRWDHRTDEINLVAARYLDLLRRDPHCRSAATIHSKTIGLLQQSSILTLRSRREVARAYQRIYELGGPEISTDLPSRVTPANIIMAITAARKHGCDLSTTGGTYNFFISEWSPLQIRNEIDSQITDEPNT
jgi:hypothetical protein